MSFFSSVFYFLNGQLLASEIHSRLEAESKVPIVPEYLLWDCLKAQISSSYFSKKQLEYSLLQDLYGLRWQHSIKRALTQYFFIYMLQLVSHVWDQNLGFCWHRKNLIKHTFEIFDHYGGNLLHDISFFWEYTYYSFGRETKLAMTRRGWIRVVV